MSASTTSPSDKASSPEPTACLLMRKAKLSVLRGFNSIVCSWDIMHPTRPVLFILNIDLFYKPQATTDNK